MDGRRFDELARTLAARTSRRGLLRTGATAGIAGGFAVLGRGKASAAPIGGAFRAPAARSQLDDAQAVIDAMDPETRQGIARALWTTELVADDLPADTLAAIIDPKNSNAAFGERFRTYVSSLLAEPDSFTRSYERGYSTYLDYAESLSPHQAYAMRNLLGADASRGYAPTPAAAGLQFPRDNAIALQSQVGWYFFVGSAMGENGKEYGIEMMFFRNALLPPPLAAELGLSNTENQIIELQLSVTEAGGRHYQAKPIVVAGTTGLLSFEAEGFGMAMGKNVARSLEAGSLYPLQVQGWGIDDVPDAVELSIDLVFASGRDYLLQGVDGCMPCCDGVGTLYYSIPNLQLDPARSSLTLMGESVALSSGAFWFDHQWGMLGGNPQSDVLRAAGNLSPARPYGWDWFMTHFDGNRQITLAAGHTADNLEFYFQTGSASPGTMTAPVKGKLMDADGEVRDILGSMAVTEWIKSTDSPDPDMYWPTNTWYPNRWEFTFGDDVPEDIRVFSMEPIVDSGQSGYFALGGQYSEGAVYLRDGNGDLVGRGFAESVQYADTTLNQLALAGLPGTPEMVKTLAPGDPSPELVSESQAYVIQHAGELKDTLAICKVFF